jgi:hypothetical protein
MSKKKKPEEYEFFTGRVIKRSRPGRPPSKPEGLENCLEDFSDHTWAWVYRFREVWSDPGQPFKYARGAGDCPNCLELYEDAIKAIKMVELEIVAAKKMMEEGKKAAVERLKPAQAPAAQKKKPSEKVQKKEKQAPKAAKPPTKFDEYGFPT